METLKRNTGANCKRRHHEKRHWTPDENYLLIMLVKKHGPANWDFIAEHIKGRTGKSCRLRWINQLNPRVNKKPFSQEEKLRLFELHGRLGNKWATIADSFPGRTDNQVKNQYHLLVGTRKMKALAQSYVANPHSEFKKRSVDSSNYGSISMVAVDLQVLDISHQGNMHSRFAPGFAPSLDRLGNTPNSAAFSEICPVPMPKQGVGARNYQFIDFLGVESSD